MIAEERLRAIQAEIQAQQLDGWLFFDHHHRDPLAYEILAFTPGQMASRRWFYFIPAIGEPRKLTHRVESRMLDILPGERELYSGWQSLREGLAKLLRGSNSVAMQYSPNCEIPYVAMVDAGTVELIRGLGVSVVSSADLIQTFHARLTDDQIELHLSAGRAMDRIRAEVFQQAAHRTHTEHSLQSWLLEAFSREGLTTDHGPIIAINDHAADPHFEPSPENSRPIRDGDLLLVDMWAKWNRPGGVYYDITWTAYLGAAPSEEMDRVFDIVSRARDAAFARVKAAMETGEPIHGYQVDDAARTVISAEGFADAFVHRTGHSITEDVHGTGANMDNLETHDVRRIIPDTLFSVEPGIYLDRFGIRSEYNVLARDRTAIVTGAIQEKLLRI
jgi:Xaa-Pro aminopeptidase